MESVGSEEELEELLSRPSVADVESLRQLTGDLLILGAGGKMGPTLAMRAARAFAAAGGSQRVIAVARFSDGGVRARLEAAGITTIAADLLAPGTLAALPDAANVVYMAARKFGTAGNEHLTWAMNAHLPGLVAQRYRDAKIVAFSSGNVYPLRSASLGGASERDVVAPVGEYGQSVLGRERLFEYGSKMWGTRVAILRLNYAVDLRYGVLVDIAQAVYEQRRVNLAMGLVNVIWQGDANSYCLRSFDVCASPPAILNVTGPETLSVRYLAGEFWRRFGVTPMFEGTESQHVLLNNSARTHQLFGYPSVSAYQMLDWVACWIADGKPLHGKPTHFEVQDGNF